MHLPFPQLVLSALQKGWVRRSTEVTYWDRAHPGALAHHELEIQANSDPLTGMANRRGLALCLEGDRRPEAMGILVMDIDNLKAINDVQGHDVGDKILVGVARAVSGVLRGGRPARPAPAATSRGRGFGNG